MSSWRGAWWSTGTISLSCATNVSSNPHSLPRTS